MPCLVESRGDHRQGGGSRARSVRKLAPQRVHDLVCSDMLCRRFAAGSDPTTLPLGKPNGKVLLSLRDERSPAQTHLQQGHPQQTQAHARGARPKLHQEKPSTSRRNGHDLCHEVAAAPCRGPPAHGKAEPPPKSPRSGDRVEQENRLAYGWCKPCHAPSSASAPSGSRFGRPAGQAAKKHFACLKSTPPKSKLPSFAKRFLTPFCYPSGIRMVQTLSCTPQRVFQVRGPDARVASVATSLGPVRDRTWPSVRSTDREVVQERRRR
jgi:hypothetical protein